LALILDRRSFLAVLAASAAGSRAASAASYPTGPVKIVVPFPAGGPADFMARMIGTKLSEQLAQQFYIENKPGAGGNLGLAQTARSAADGNTFVVTLGASVTANPSLYKNVGDAPFKDLAPVAILSTSTNMLVVHPSLNIHSVGDFVSYAKDQALKAQPIIYASGGIGTPGQLVMEYFRLRAGFNAVHVPYRGNAPMVVDLVSGQVKFAFVATAGMIEHVRSDTVRALAVSSRQRSALAPDVPTMIESGYPDFDVQTNMVMMAPADMPAAISEVIRNSLSKALQDAELVAVLAKTDTIPALIFDPAATQLLKKEAAQWATVIKSARIVAD
jgi:tripartite-type tricarboxylate transporter receptor subunit TctC